MKKIALILLAAILPLTAGAQSNDFSKLQEKYSGKDGYTVIEITSAMLDLVRKGNKNKQVTDMIGAIDGISHIVIITSELRSDEFTADLKKISSGQTDYKLLTSVVECDQNVMFMYREAKNASKKDDDTRISELIMIVTDSSESLIMHIQGDFSIKQINSAISRD